MPVSIAPAEMTTAVAAPVTITESLDVGESLVTDSLVPSIEVPADIFEPPAIITDYDGKDEKVAIVIGTVIIGIWLLRLVMSFLPFVVGLGLAIVGFKFFL